MMATSYVGEALVRTLGCWMDDFPWRRERAEDGVTVYSASRLPCPFEGFMTVTEPRAPVDALARFLGEGLLEAMAEMNDRYVGGEIVRRIDDGPDHRTTVVRTAFRMPPGMAGREFVHLVHERRRSRDEAFVAYGPVDEDDLPPPPQGFVRCPIYPSGQRLRAIGGGRTRVEHLMVYALAGWAQNTLFHAGHVRAYLDEWKGLLRRFEGPAGAGGAGG
jgi:hypothetical protein